MRVWGTEGKFVSQGEPKHTMLFTSSEPDEGDGDSWYWTEGALELEFLFCITVDLSSNLYLLTGNSDRFILVFLSPKGKCHVTTLYKQTNSPDYGTCLYTADSSDPLTYTVVALKYIFVHILPEDAHRSGPKHVVSSTQ
jgi:hypothetical protein